MQCRFRTILVNGGHKCFDNKWNVDIDNCFNGGDVDIPSNLCN